MAIAVESWLSASAYWLMPFAADRHYDLSVKPLCMDGVRIDIRQLSTYGNVSPKPYPSTIYSISSTLIEELSFQVTKLLFLESSLGQGLEYQRRIRTAPWTAQLRQPSNGQNSSD